MEVEGQTTVIDIAEVHGETVRYERPSAWRRGIKALATYVVAGLVYWAYLETQYAMQHVSEDAASAWFGTVGFIVTSGVCIGFVGIRLEPSASQCSIFGLGIPVMALLMTSSVLTLNLMYCSEAESLRALPIVHQPVDVKTVLRNDIGARLTLDPSRLQPYTGESNAFTSMFYRVTLIEDGVLFGEHVPTLQTPLPLQPDGLLWLSLAPANWSIGLSFAMIDLQRHHPHLNLSAAPFVLSTNDLLSHMQNQERKCRRTWNAIEISLPIISVAIILTDACLSYWSNKLR